MNTPFEVVEGNVAGIKSTAIADSEGEVICHLNFIEKEKEVAAFIVTACNAHDDLIEALKNISMHANGDCNHSDLEDCGHEIKVLAQKALTKAGIKV